MSVFRVVTPTVCAALSLLVWLVPPVRAQSTPRLVTVISDLHLGVGRASSGAWHPREDFRWDAEFALFLETLDAQGDSANDLILNGDTFELLETVEDDCRYDPPYGCTEAEALARLGRVLSAHEPAVSGLAHFARSGSNRLMIVPGDHDAALLFPSVGQRVVQALGGSAARVEVRSAGFWASADGQIYAEHGHQITHRANRFARWPSPFVEDVGREHLERPWGQQTVTAFYAQQESRFPVIDNLADRGAGLRYGLAASAALDVGDQATAFLRYVLFRMPWSQFRVDLDAGDVRPPAWDLPAIRAQGPTFLAESLPDDHRFKPLATAALDAGRLAELMGELSDPEITAICDYRAAVRRSRRRFERILTQLDPQGPVVAECPREPKTRGAAFDYFWRTRDLVFSRQLELAQQRLGDDSSGPEARPIGVFVHGHTHLVDWRQRVLGITSQGDTVILDGFSPVRGALAPVVVNGGAWQRTVTPVQLEALKQAHVLTDAELLETLRPEHLAPCYSFVQVEPYEETPGLPVIRYWRQGPDGWEMAALCDVLPSLAPEG